MDIILDFVYTGGLHLAIDADLVKMHTILAFMNSQVTEVTRVFEGLKKAKNLHSRTARIEHFS